MSTTILIILWCAAAAAMVAAFVQGRRRAERLRRIKAFRHLRAAVRKEGV